MSSENLIVICIFVGGAVLNLGISYLIRKYFENKDSKEKKTHHKIGFDI